jgi:CRP-like cAMP-binding protein
MIEQTSATSITPASATSGTSSSEQLKQSSLFKGVSLSDLEALVDAMDRTSYPAGAQLFAKGDPGDLMYIILSGKVRIYTHDADHKEFTLTEYGMNKVFGDFSILDEQPRSAYAKVIEPVELLTLSREQFLSFLPTQPSLGLTIIRHLTDRLRYITVYLNKVTTFGQRLANGEYEKAIQEFTTAGESGAETDMQIESLIAAFMQMAQSVKEREEHLTIDNSKQK